MALIECLECGRRISDLATTCPQCGRPNTPVNQEFENNSDKIITNEYLEQELEEGISTFETSNNEDDTNILNSETYIPIEELNENYISQNEYLTFETEINVSSKELWDIFIFSEAIVREFPSYKSTLSFKNSYFAGKSFDAINVNNEIIFRFEGKRINNKMLWKSQENILNIKLYDAALKAALIRGDITSFSIVSRTQSFETLDNYILCNTSKKRLARIPLKTVKEIMSDRNKSNSKLREKEIELREKEIESSIDNERKVNKIYNKTEVEIIEIAINKAIARGDISSREVVDISNSKLCQSSFSEDIIVNLFKFPDNHRKVGKFLSKVIIKDNEISNKKVIYESRDLSQELPAHKKLNLPKNIYLTEKSIINQEFKNNQNRNSSDSQFYNQRNRNRSDYMNNSLNSGLLNAYKRRQIDTGWGYAFAHIIPFVWVYYGLTRRTITPIIYNLAGGFCFGFFGAIVGIDVDNLVFLIIPVLSKIGISQARTFAKNRITGNGTSNQANNNYLGKKFCTKCGAKLELNDKFCRGCGLKINSVIQPSRDISQTGDKQFEIKPNQGRDYGSKNNPVGSFTLQKEASVKEVFEKLVELLEKENFQELIESIDKKNVSFNIPIFGGKELIVQDCNGETILLASTAGSLPEGLIWQVELI